jgi:CHASE3 domain sensor protein
LNSALFFKEQMERYYENLDKQISDNKEISRTINEIKELEYKIAELEIEIEKSPNTENILKIIEDARKHRRTSIEIKTPFDNLFVAIYQLLRLR